MSSSQEESTAILEAGSDIGFPRDKIDLIKRTVAKDATDDELKLFLHQAQKMGLDPLSKQIYFQKYKNYKTGEDNITIIVAIDGYRLVADRSGKYAGSDDPIFDDEKNPTKATVTVYKLVSSVRCPFTATARWEQYCPKPPKDYMWKKMPHAMLAKCAEALALRKAFPADLSGVYTAEEMDQAHEEIKTFPITVQNPIIQKVLGTVSGDKFEDDPRMMKREEAPPVEPLDMSWNSKDDPEPPGISVDALKVAGEYVIQFNFGQDKIKGMALKDFRRPDQISNVAHATLESWGFLKKVYAWAQKVPEPKPHITDFIKQFRIYSTYFDSHRAA